MWKKLKELLEELQQIDFSKLNKDEKTKIKDSLLTKIGFFQHERIVHLIVTVCVALLSLINIIVIYLSNNFASIILEILLLGLLAPYLLHYYRLENGVQKLYDYFDKIDI